MGSRTHSLTKSPGADLGVDTASLPEAGGLPALDEPGAAWGALYVVEGATLGGRVLGRLVTERLGAAPVRFLSGYGTRTRPAWRELGQLADRYVRTEPDALLAERTAVAAFAAFTAWAQAARRPDQVR
jgi:heme oxygenase